MGTTKKSIATMSVRWLSKNERHVWEGGLSRRGLYLKTVESLTSMPILASSARMRGLPQVGFELHMSRISSRTSRSILGRPPLDRLFQRQ